jgi:hypothetical protein
MLRVNRLAAPIDITAAGTNAPIAIAANENHKEALIANQNMAEAGDIS